MKIFIWISILIPVNLLSQEEIKPKYSKAGWAAYIGAGIMFAGNIGIQIENQILLMKKLRFSPFVSSGFAEDGTNPTTSKKYFWIGYAAGGNFEYGKKHRIILGTHLEGNNLLGKSNKVKKYFFGGLSSIIGYKGTTNFGLIWQIYIGDFYSTDDDSFSANKKYEHRSHIGLGIGYKF